MISFSFLFTITMVMKGNQNNLDQRKEILDIKDRSILCPQSKFLLTFSPLSITIPILENNFDCDSNWVEHQGLHNVRRKKGRLNITKGGVGSWAKEAVFAILMLLFAQTSSIATTVQSNIKLMASKHLKQNLQECIFAFVSPALECPCWPWIISPKWWETATKEVINQIICTNFHINSLFQTETDAIGTIINYGLWTTFFIWNKFLRKKC